MQRLCISFKTCMLNNPNRALLLLQFLYHLSLNIMWNIAIKHRVNIWFVIYG